MVVELSQKNWLQSYKKTIKKWGVKYHQLIMGKPSYDLIVDDLAIYFKKHSIKKLINIYNYGSTYSII